MVAPVSETILNRQEGSRLPINLTSNERLASAAVGGALLVLGFKRLSLPLMLMTAAGGALVARAVTGYCPLTPVDGSPEDTRHLTDEAAQRAGRRQPGGKVRR